MIQGAQPGSAVAVGDLNGDGRADVVVSLATTPPSIGELGILFSLGDGTFSPPVSTGIAMSQPQLADVDKDGRLDIYGMAESSSGMVVSQVVMNVCP